VGVGYSIEMPAGWQEVQDNRFFNWATFVHIFTYQFNVHPNVNEFEFTIEAEPKGNGDSKLNTMVDRFGQLVAAQFPTKVTSEQELKDDVVKEAAYYAELSEPSRDIYGGLLGSYDKFKLRRTGFFHLEKAAGRDVLVTPEGNLFFQLGLCSFQLDGDQTVVKGRERIFKWLPPERGGFAPAWGRQAKGIVSFYIANGIRKYGASWNAEKWSARMVARVRKWGFNSAGAFSQETAAMDQAHFGITPELPLYLYQAPGLKVMEGVDRMYDPFAPGVETAIDKAFAAMVAPQALNPNIIGYFFNNEVLFENIPKLVPAQRANSPSKLRLVQLLKERYQGDITKFNAAWEIKAPFSNFEELENAPLFVTTAAASNDMQAFLRLYLETHFGQVIKAFHKYDKNHLLLGSRWQTGTANHEMLVKITSRYVDGISINYYTYAIEKDFLERIHNWSGGKPLLLSEWYFSCPDQCMTGIKEVATQRDRGMAYRNYVENAAQLPFIIGQQWFSCMDQPVTGRWFEGVNGEASNIGLFNVADRPYFDFVAECKKTNDDIYKVMFGERNAFQFDDPRFVANVGSAPKVVVIPRALLDMKLDGSSQRWPGVPPESLLPKNLTQGTPDAEFGTSFRLCWDDANLYILAEVKDRTPLVNSQNGRDLWNGDALEIFIGPDSIDQPGALLGSDRQVLLGAAEKPKYCIQNSPTQPRGVQMLTAKNGAGDGYSIEAVLPWVALGITPKPGLEFRFDVAVDNGDAPGIRSRQWIWNGNSRNSTDRSGWGKAKLRFN